MVYVCVVATSQAMRELTANMALNRHVSKAALAFFSSYTSAFTWKQLWIMTTAYIS